MHKYLTLIIVLLFTISASAQDKSLPNIPDLMKSVYANQAKVTKILENYTYNEELKDLVKDSNGQTTVKSSETYAMTFYKGHRVRRLIAKDGKPLNAKEDEKELKDVTKEIEKIDKGKGSSRALPSIGTILRVTTTSEPRIERYNNRDCIVFSFKPNEKIKAKNKLENVAQKLIGKVWIDPEDKQVAKLEAEFVKPFKIAGGLFATVKKGATISLEQTRINNEVWLPSLTSLQIPLKVFFVKTINVYNVVTYSDYKRFNVDSEKEKLIDPPVQQF